MYRDRASRCAHFERTLNRAHALGTLRCLRCRFLLLYHVRQEVRIGDEVDASVGTADGGHSMVYTLDGSGDAVEADLIPFGYAFRDMPARCHVPRDLSKS